jgi:alpha-ketoglutarate-dependent taurine dioxygenase
MTLETRQLSPIGVEVVDADIELLLEDDSVASEILDLLDANGVVLFRELGLSDEELVMFGRHLGPTLTKTSKGWDPTFPELFTVTLEPGAVAGAYMKSTFDWHIDGSTLPIPQKASILTARVLSKDRSDTRFASTYAAYEGLSDEEKARFDDLKVWHDLQAVNRRYESNPSPEAAAHLENYPPVLQPLVWTHRDGRKSLVIGTPAASIDGLPEEEGMAILADLLARATDESLVYSHAWKIGDVVIWDNRGVLHQAMPYDEESGRSMKRVTLVGDEPIQ